MNNYEIIVAGGGPIGCFIGEKLASQGINVAVMEEHNTIGEPLHCAGLVTQRVFSITQCSQTGIVQNKIYGAHIHSPDGSILNIVGKKIHAFVINRKCFDQRLAQAAETAGVDLLLGHKISDIAAANINGFGNQVLSIYERLEALQKQPVAWMLNDENIHNHRE